MPKGPINPKHTPHRYTTPYVPNSKGMGGQKSKKGFYSGGLSEAKNKVPYNKGGGRDKKPPTNDSGCCLALVIVGFGSTLAVGNAIVQSFI